MKRLQRRREVRYGEGRGMDEEVTKKKKGKVW